MLPISSSNQLNANNNTQVQKIWLSPKKLNLIQNQNIKDKLQPLLKSFQVTHQKINFEYYLSLDSPHQVILFQAKAPIDFSLGTIAFLCRYRTQPHYLKQTQLLKQWHQNVSRGKKTKAVIENNNQIFYLPPDQQLLQSLKYMLTQLIKQNWTGTYIGLFMPKNLEKQFFLLQIFDAINEISSTNIKLLQRFQFIVFETNQNQNFRYIINKLQDANLSNFNSQWHWLDQGTPTLMKYNTSHFIQNSPYQQVLLTTNMIYNPQKNFQLDVNNGHIRKKGDKRALNLLPRLIYDNNKLYLSTFEHILVQLPNNEINKQHYLTFIKNQKDFLDKQEKRQIELRKNQTQRLQKQKNTPQTWRKFMQCIFGKPQSLAKQTFYKQAISENFVDIQLGLYKVNRTKMQQFNLVTGNMIRLMTKSFNRPNFYVEEQNFFSLVQISYDKKNQNKINSILQKEVFYTIISQLNLPKVIQKSASNRLINQNKVQNLTKISYPKQWDPNLDKQKVHLVQIKKNSPEYTFVSGLFMINNQSINFKLQRIQNAKLYEKYFTEKAYLEKQYGQKLDESFLFHGTRVNPPESIYNDICTSYNINYAQDGYRGKGIYFAKEASYSNNYTHNINGQQMMLLNIVLTGHCQQIDTKVSIKQTSFRDSNKKWRYESVFSRYDGSDIYVVYLNNRAYPLYLITYSYDKAKKK